MRVHICAFGRLRAGPERDLLDDYLTRFERTGRSLGLGSLTVLRSKIKKAAACKAKPCCCNGVIPKGAVICVLDERGRVMPSPDFAKKIGDWRDQGTSDLAFIHWWR